MARMREACRSLPGRLELPTLRLTASRSSQLREREGEGERDGDREMEREVGDGGVWHWWSQREGGNADAHSGFIRADGRKMEANRTIGAGGVCSEASFFAGGGGADVCIVGPYICVCVFVCVCVVERSRGMDLTSR